MSELERLDVEGARAARVGLREWLADAARELRLGEAAHVVDYGGADGGLDPATLLGVRSIWGERGAQTVLMSITGGARARFTDLAPVANGLCVGSGAYVSMVPRELSAALVAPDSVDLGLGVTGLLQLSKDAGPLGGHLQANASGDPEALERYAKVARSDWRRFLMRRAMELKPGGHLVLAVPSRDAKGRILGDDGRIHPALEQLRVQWNQLQKEGRIGSEAAHRARLPVYFRSPDELCRPFEEGGEALALGLHLRRSEVVLEPCPHRARLDQDGDADRFARGMCEELRALAEPSLAGVLGERPDGHAVLDTLFSRLGQVLRRDPERHGLPRVFVRLHIHKESARPDDGSRG